MATCACGTACWWRCCRRSACSRARRWRTRYRSARSRSRSRSCSSRSRSASRGAPCGRDDASSGISPPMPKRILALVSEPVSADALKSAVGPEHAANAEVLVVAPALNSRKRFFLADPDPAIERAEDVQQETVERLDEEGIDAAGDTGEEDPLLALQDSLATFPADEVVLFTHAGGKANWLEEGLVEEAQRRVDVPVRHIVVE